MYSYSLCLFQTLHVPLLSSINHSHPTQLSLFLVLCQLICLNLCLPAQLLTTLALLLPSITPASLPPFLSQISYRRSLFQHKRSSFILVVSSPFGHVDTQTTSTLYLGGQWVVWISSISWNRFQLMKRIDLRYYSTKIHGHDCNFFDGVSIQMMMCNIKAIYFRFGNLSQIIVIVTHSQYMHDRSVCAVIVITKSDVFHIINFMGNWYC